MEKEQVETSRQLNERDVLLRAMTDPSAFKPIYERYFRQIFLFVYRRVEEREQSADITQQVFLKALTTLGRYQFKGVPFSAWLYRIAINECNDYFRRTKRHRCVVIDESHVEALFEELMTDSNLEHLHQKLPVILAALSTHELHLVELRYFESRPFKEIAEVFGITETHAKVRTYRVLDKMKKLFLKHEA